MGTGHSRTVPFLPHAKHKRCYGSTQRSVTPPPIVELIPGSADTASTVSSHYRRKQRIEELRSRNPNLDFRLPTSQGATVGHLVITGKQVQCSNSRAREAVWDPVGNCVDPNVSEVLQLMCERTLKCARGGVCVTLHKGVDTYNFVSHNPNAPPAVKVSVQLIGADDDDDLVGAVSANSAEV